MTCVDSFSVRRSWGCICDYRQSTKLKNLEVLTFLIDVPVLGILVLSSLILLPVLLPVSATDIGDTITNTTTSNGTFSDLDMLSIGHVQVTYIIFYEELICL